MPLEVDERRYSTYGTKRCHWWRIVMSCGCWSPHISSPALLWILRCTAQSLLLRWQQNCNAQALTAHHDSPPINWSETVRPTHCPLRQCQLSPPVSPSWPSFVHAVCCSHELVVPWEHMVDPIRYFHWCNENWGVWEMDYTDVFSAC